MSQSTIEYLEWKLEQVERKEAELFDELDSIERDMVAFHAPSECYALAYGNRFDKADELGEEQRKLSRQLKELTGFEYRYLLCHHDYPAEHCQDCQMEEMEADAMEVAWRN